MHLWPTFKSLFMHPSHHLHDAFYLCSYCSSWTQHPCKVCFACEKMYTQHLGPCLCALTWPWSQHHKPVVTTQFVEPQNGADSFCRKNILDTVAGEDPSYGDIQKLWHLNMKSKLDSWWKRRSITGRWLGWPWRWCSRQPSMRISLPCAPETWPKHGGAVCPVPPHMLQHWWKLGCAVFVEKDTVQNLGDLACFEENDSAQYRRSGTQTSWKTLTLRRLLQL